MKGCLNCYHPFCPDRSKASEMTSNYQVLCESAHTLSHFLAGVITDCSVCPVTYCAKDKLKCEKTLKGWLSSKMISVSDLQTIINRRMESK